MRKVLIVRTGTSGLQLSRGLIRFGYHDTVSRGESRSARPSITQFTPPSALAHEEATGLIDPDPGLAASTLDVGQGQVTVTDARSRPATRSSLHQLLRRLEIS
ncbi:hypothetical protein [Nocardiopsis alborubida]|uniref:Uncharacterized protein n=1 Tax=Nocardiopsis alborubida TaxID=146802 RepID=A0A7X6M9U6_9ACTN|nr:hypothetical protein [Nocardiopsis alborubida]NKY96649.1 hypothetical protein [Nocardiopsis alborubida]